MKSGRHVVDAGDAAGVLRGQRGDHRRAVDAERREGLQVGLDAGAAAGIRARDGDGNRGHCPARLRQRGVDDAQQCRAAAARGSGASDSAEITATPSAPASITGAALPALMPAMAQIGKSGLARDAAPAMTRAMPAMPIGVFLVVLRGRAVDAADADIVEQIERRVARAARAVLMVSPMIASGPSSRRASAGAMSSQPMCTPSAADGERDVDAVVDHQRHAQPSAALMARARSIMTRVSAELVAQAAPASRRRRPACGRDRPGRGRRPPPDRRWHSSEDRL